jgi:hypothetical protein
MTFLFQSQIGRAYHRNSGARGKIFFRGPIFSQKCWRAGGGGENFFPDIPKKIKKIFPDKFFLNCIAKTFFGPIPANSGSENFF